MGEQVTKQIQVDSELREEVARVFEDLGLDLSTGVRMYLKVVARERGIPFNPYLKREDEKMPNNVEQEIEQVMRTVTYQST